MKKILLSVPALIAYAALFAQNVDFTGYADIRRGEAGSVPYNDLATVFAPQAQGNMDKEGPISFYISYAESNTTDDQLGTLGGGRFIVNSGFLPQDTGITSVAVTLRPYVGFTDYEDISGSYYEALSTAPGAVLRVDSISVVMGHNNTSGQPSRIYTTLTGAQTVTFPGGVQLSIPNNTVYFRDSIITTTSLSPSGSPFGTGSTYVWDMAPNYQHTMSAGHLCIRFEGYTEPGDTLAITGLYMSIGDSVLPPLIYNSSFRRSDQPTFIYLTRVNWYIATKVTYSSLANIQNLEANGFAIHSLMPNPANSTTLIRFELKESADVTFLVTDMSGKQVAMISLPRQNAGTQNYTLNTADFAAGMYNITMKVKDMLHTQKLSVVK